VREFDLIVSGGLVFDGRGGEGQRLDVGVRDGDVVALSAAPLRAGEGTTVVDATGCWVTPGFIDLHTHYDAEVEVAPGLDESVRHGVTTAVIGSCSLSLAVGDPDDLADMFCRVEAIPDDVVRPILQSKKTWHTHREYLQHLDTLPLGPNLASFVGHSALRAHVMGLARSVEPGVVPTDDELSSMEQIVEDALDAGYLGVSLMTLPWDKLGGTGPLRSRPLPSTYATWSELRRFTRILRRRGRVLQAVPNLSRSNFLAFLVESMGIVRAPLKTTVLSMAEVKAVPGLHRVLGALSRVFNVLLDADFRWQALPNLFDLWGDGIDLVVFEEFGAGAAALHLQSEVERGALLNNPAYRARFKREWKSLLLPKVFHRDFNESEILACPDTSLVGQSFVDVGRARGVDAVDAFLDLVVAYGKQLRWYTVHGNARLSSIHQIMSHPDVLIGFSDAGAHLRQMAHYNFPLRMLRHANDALNVGRPVMSIGRAVQRCTSEIATWLGLDAGVLAMGRRADVVVLDPRFLDARVEVAHEAPIAGFGDHQRLVRRNAELVRRVFIGGKAAVVDGVPVDALGRERFGRVRRATAPATPAPAR
jgi:N-acyl-D-aspartate/D-glutamate deacylase